MAMREAASLGLGQREGLEARVAGMDARIRKTAGDFRRDGVHLDCCEGVEQAHGATSQQQGRKRDALEVRGRGASGQLCDEARAALGTVQQHDWRPEARFEHGCGRCSQ